MQVSIQMIYVLAPVVAFAMLAVILALRAQYPKRNKRRR